MQQALLIAPHQAQQHFTTLYTAVGQQSIDRYVARFQHYLPPEWQVIQQITEVVGQSVRTRLKDS
jgi:hypothetical protein